MDNRKQTILLLVACLVATIVAGMVGWYLRTKTQKPEKEPETGVISTNDLPTDAGVVFDESAPTADPLIVGRWQNSANPLWHKVYYDDPDEEEGLYWGKEWNEEDDVLEEDLRYHGNGWFRWDKRGNTLREFATMDTRDVPIGKIYTVCYASTDSMAYYEPDYPKQVYRFSRSSD